MKIKVVSIIFVLLFCVWFTGGIDYAFGDDGSSTYAMTFGLLGEEFAEGNITPDKTTQTYCWIISGAFCLWVVGFIIEFFVKNKAYIKLYCVFTGIFAVIFAGQMLVRDGFSLYGDLKVDLSRLCYFLALACLILAVFIRNKELKFTKTS